MQITRSGAAYAPIYYSPPISEPKITQNNDGTATITTPPGGNLTSHPGGIYTRNPITGKLIAVPGSTTPGKIIGTHVLNAPPTVVSPPAAETPLQAFEAAVNNAVNNFITAVKSAFSKM